MAKYTAIAMNNDLISVYADSKAEAERMITIHLTGRPGIRDLYEIWVEGGKEIKEVI